jgi:hypothetical protein
VGRLRPGQARGRRGQGRVLPRLHLE